MDKEQAYRTFAPYLDWECPECKAPVEVLCDTGGVWVHLARMKLHPDFVA